MNEANLKRAKKYYIERGIALMNTIEDKTQKLMSEREVTANLEDSFWGAVDHGEVRTLKFIVNRLALIVDEL